MIRNLCIFTPTYNRSYTLPKLYESLIGQDCADFVWMIVDDGSTDSTEELVNHFVSEGRIEIQYYRIENGGKQRAYNYAVEKCENPLFMCVDSDDVLTPNAVQVLLSEWEKVSDDQRIAGMAVPRTALNDMFPEQVRCKLADIYHKYNYRGETIIMERTEIAKQYLFVVECGERFIPEVYVFDQIDRDFYHYCIGSELCHGEYLEDGYSRNYGKLLLSSPLSYARYKLQCSEFSNDALTRTKELILYLVWMRIAGKTVKESLGKTPQNLRSAACLLVLPSRLAYHVVLKAMSDN